MKPSVMIVDINDRPVGNKHRADLTPNDIYRVTGLWATNSRGDVLLAQRKWSKKHDPGKWGPAVAGTVEPGETYESNVYKEAEEEIGLMGVRFTEGLKTFNDGEHQHFIQWFVATIDWPIERFTLQKEEVEALAWLPRQQLLREVAETPEKFIAGFGHWIELF